MNLFRCSQLLLFFCFLPEEPVLKDETELNDIELRVTANMEERDGWVEIHEKDFNKMAVMCSAFNKRTGQLLTVQPPIFWSKDGVYVDFHVKKMFQSLVHDPTKSFVLDVWSEAFYPQLKQGTFWCESWIPNSPSRLVSNKLLITLKDWMVLILVAKRKESVNANTDDAIDKIRETFRSSKLNIDNYTIDLISTEKDVLRNNANCLTTYRFQVHIPLTTNSRDSVLGLFQNDSHGYNELYKQSGYLSTLSASLGTYCLNQQENYEYGNAIEWPITKAGKVNPKRYRCRKSGNELQPGFCQWNYTHGATINFDPSECEQFDSCPLGYKSIANYLCISISEPETWEKGLKGMYGTGNELSILDAPEFFEVHNSRKSIYMLVKEIVPDNFTSWLPVRRIISNGPLTYMGPGQMAYPYSDYGPSDLYNISWADRHPVSNQDCLALNLKTNHLSTLNCNGKIPYISILNVSGLDKIPNPDWKSFLPQLITDKSYCQESWVSTGIFTAKDVCFKIFLNVGELTWERAKEFCIQKGAHLPTPGIGFLDWVFRQFIYNQNVESVWTEVDTGKENVNRMDFVNWKASTDYSLPYSSMNTEGWQREREGKTKSSVLCQMDVMVRNIKKLHLTKISTHKKKGKSKKNRNTKKSDRICLDFINISASLYTETKCYINGKQSSLQQLAKSTCLLDTTNLQGYYQCHLWLKNPALLLRSNVLLNQDSNILTFSVTLLQAYIYHPEHHDSTFIYSKSQVDYKTECVTTFISFLQNEIGNMNISHSNFFYSPGLNDGELLHNFNMKLTMKKVFEGLVSEYDMLIKLSSIFAKDQNISVCDLVSIQSTIGCIGEITRVYGLVEKNLTWPTVQGNKVVLPKELCITDDGKPVTRECEGDFLNGYRWGQISDGCTGKASNLTRSLWNISRNENSKENADLILMSNLTADGSMLKPADIHFVAIKFQSLSKYGLSSEMGLEEIVETLNNVMEANDTAFKFVQNRLNTSGILFEAFENITFNIKLPSANGDQTLDASRKLISVERLDLEINSSVIGYQSVEGGKKQVTIKRGFSEGSIKGNAAIIFPENLTYIVATDSDKLAKIQSDVNKTKIKLTFAVYRTPKLFQDHKSFPNFSVGGDIIQARYDGKIIKDLMEPVKILFKSTAEQNDSKCVYWDFEKNQGLGGWSTEGCWKGGHQGDYDICLCNHLTCFAQLMNFSDEGFDGIHAIVLDLITIIGCSLSIIGLLMVFTTFFLFKKWRRPLSNKILVNLSFAVFCSIVIFLAGINQTWNIILCRSVAVSLHYFILASFGWMLVEAVHQYLKFVKVVGTYIPRFLWKASVTAWGVPILPIMVVLVYDSTLYDSKGDELSGTKICWMSSEGFMYAFLPPLALTMLVNTIMFSLIIHGAICGRTRVNSTLSERSLFMSQFTMGVCVFFLLGFTWIFGILSIWKGRLLFSYLFCIFNTLQGFFIFLFHVCRERTARRLWKEFLAVIAKVPVSTSDPENSNNLNSMRSRGRLDTVNYNQRGGNLVLPRRESVETVKSKIINSRASFRP